MYDFHIHSNFSSDSTQTLNEIAQSAIESGLKGICITDHVDLEYNSDIIFDIDDKKYSAAINDLRIHNKAKLKIYKGLEFGLQAHALDKCRDYLKSRSYDFIIGSIHAVKTKELYNNIYLTGISDHQGILNYFEEMHYCISNFDDFDVFGHLDVFRRYLNSGEHSFSIKKYFDFIEEALKCLISKGKGIEINTSGMYNLNNFHPLPEIIKLYRSLGGEIITIGSDSHKPEYVGYAFDKAFDMLLQLGFKYYNIFRDRKAEFIKL